MGGIVRLSARPARDRDRILFCNPDNLARADGKEAPGKNRDRKNLSVKLSYDEGQTWPVNKAVEPGWSAYSDIAVTKGGTILCFLRPRREEQLRGRSAHLGPLQSRMAHRRQGFAEAVKASLHSPGAPATGRRRVGPGKAKDPETQAARSHRGTSVSPVSPCHPFSRAALDLS